MALPKMRIALLDRVSDSGNAAFWVNCRSGVAARAGLFAGLDAEAAESAGPGRLCHPTAGPDADGSIS